MNKTVSESIQENSFCYEKLKLNKVNIIGFRIFNGKPSKHSTSIHIIRVPKYSTIDCKSSSIVLKSNSINAHQNKDNIYINLLKVIVDPKKDKENVVNLICETIIKVVDTLFKENSSKNSNSNKNNVMTICFEAWSPKKIFEFKPEEKCDQNQMNSTDEICNIDKEFYNRKLRELFKSEQGKNIMIFISESKIPIDQQDIIPNKLNDEDGSLNIKNQFSEEMEYNKEINTDEKKYISVPKITIFSASKDIEDEKDMDKLKKRRESRRPISAFDLERRRKNRMTGISERANRRSRSRDSSTSSRTVSPKTDDKDSKNKNNVIMRNEKDQMGQKTYTTSQLATNIITISDSDSDNNEKDPKKDPVITEEVNEDDDKSLDLLNIQSFSAIMRTPEINQIILKYNNNAENDISPPSVNKTEYSNNDNYNDDVNKILPDSIKNYSNVTESSLGEDKAFGTQIDNISKNISKIDINKDTYTGITYKNIEYDSNDLMTEMCPIHHHSYIPNNNIQNNSNNNDNNDNGNNSNNDSGNQGKNIKLIYY